MRATQSGVKGELAEDFGALVRLGVARDADGVTQMPTGTVTFLFTDVEGSTRLLTQLGDGYAEVLADHRRVLRDAFVRHGGFEVDTQGDAFFVAFPKASDALAAADEGRSALETRFIKVRMGLHTGEPLVTDEGYVGIDVHRAARIAAAGHGGQILVSQSTRDLAGGGSLRDLGEHRLKDLTAPERIYQFGDAEFPALKSLNQSNLPVQPTPLVGRGRELEEIDELLKSSRLLTLTGPGGAGKTRLALQAAAEILDEFPDGAWFVSLASLTDPDLVIATIAAAIGVKDDPLPFLRSKRLLLLLDNLEQLLPAAAPPIANLLAGASDVKVIATSRERIGVSAEQEYQVPMLPLHDAVSLFTARARQLRPTFEPGEEVTQIARRLDGLPLALELAAARVKLLPPEQILQRLGHSLDLLTAGARDAPERQRTLRATIEWSYDLLREEEQQLFASLAVFAGSFDLPAADAVCGVDLDVLQSLIDKSLLRQSGEARFFMLETIHEFGEATLADRNGSGALRDHHAKYFLQLAETLEPSVKLGRAEALAALDDDHSNLRSALEWCRERHEHELLARLTAALRHYWTDHGRLLEGLRWHEEALLVSDRVPRELQAQVLHGAASIAALQGDYVRAKAFSHDGLSFFREVGDRRGSAYALCVLGTVACGEADYAKAESLYEEMLSIVRAIGDDWGVATGIHNLGVVALARGDGAAARPHLEETLGRWEALGDEAGVTLALSLLGYANLFDDLGDKAGLRFRAALSRSHQFGFPVGLAESLVGLAHLAGHHHPQFAALLLGRAQGICEEVGMKVEPFVQRVRDRALDEVAMHLQEGLAAALLEGQRASTQEVVDAALAGTDVGKY